MAAKIEEIEALEGFAEVTLANPINNAQPWMRVHYSRSGESFVAVLSRVPMAENTPLIVRRSDSAKVDSAVADVLHSTWGSLSGNLYEYPITFTGGDDVEAKYTETLAVEDVLFHQLRDLQEELEGSLI